MMMKMSRLLMLIINNFYTPGYSWNIAKVGIKH